MAVMDQAEGETLMAVLKSTLHLLEQLEHIDSKVTVLQLIAKIVRRT